MPRFYEDEGKTIMASALVEGEAVAAAQTVLDLERTQLRRFFQAARSIERKVFASPDLQETESQFRQERIRLKLLVAQGKYAQARPQQKPGQRPALGALVTFLETNIAQVQDVSDLKAFMLHFEAVIAFYDYEKMRNQRDRSGKKGRV